jgi:hypothetical protein
MWVRVLGLLALWTGLFTAGTVPGNARPLTQGGAADPDVVVRLTSPRSGERVTGQIVIAGYAADRRSTNSSGLNERDIQVWLNDASDPENLLGYASPSPDVPTNVSVVDPGITPFGFARVWDTCARPAGQYQVVVWVSSLAVPGARNVASADVEVAPCGPPGPAARPTSEAAAPPAIATGATAAPAPDQPAASRLPTASYTCRNLSSGTACDVVARGPVNTQVGGNTEVTFETMVDGVVTIERFPCAQVSDALEVTCSVIRRGHTIQNGTNTVIFTLANGQQYTFTYRGGCRPPMPPGEPCP